MNAISTNTGCPFKCIFCTKSRYPNHYFKPLNRVEKELQTYEENTQIKHYHVRDCEFGLNQNKAIQNARLLGKYNTTWQTNNRADLQTLELTEEMSAGGCQAIKFGVETGNEKLRFWLNKKITNKQITHAFNLCHDNNIETHAYFMVGIPHENKTKIRETAKLIEEIQPEKISVSILYPPKNTRLYEYLEQNKLLKTHDSSKFRNNKLVFYHEHYKHHYQIKIAQAKLISAHRKQNNKLYAIIEELLNLF